MKKQEKTLNTVSQVDLNRYLGVWYEIARYPNRFQKNCLGSRATYAMDEGGRLTVLNECHDKTTGKLRAAKGKAWVVDPSSNAKLKVSFFWPFAGDYWIIDLGENYEYAVIGHPTRKYLWILSRTEKMADDLYQEILLRIGEQGYDSSLLLNNNYKRRQP